MLESKFILIIATCLFREARGEGVEGMNHVASVIWNSTYEWEEKGQGCALEVLRPGRFDSMKGFDTSTADIPEQKGSDDEKAWKHCVATAAAMVRGKFKPINNANHYYNPDKASPSWGPRLVDTVKVGHHLFGRLV